MRLRVKWSDSFVGFLERLGINSPWQEDKELEFKSPEAEITVQGLASWLESQVEDFYYERKNDRLQMQVAAISLPTDPGREFPFHDTAATHLKPGDQILVDALAFPQAQLMALQRAGSAAQFSEEKLAQIRKLLRFDLNDRVLCFCGPRWMAGHVVGTAVVDDGDLIPYLVKTDPLPGMPGRTISVPKDRDDQICVQEVCFNPLSELHLVKSAAAPVSEPRKKLRFADGDNVVCRVRNNKDDGLEQWAPGQIGETWPRLPGEQTWSFGDISGTFPDVVPYKVTLVSTAAQLDWVYCHKDDHTLIRRKDLEPQTRVKGMSKRMEVRTNKDGLKETFDHQTERGKVLAVIDDDSDMSD
jgi:hypothetical protein